MTQNDQPTPNLWHLWWFCCVKPSSNRKWFGNTPTNERGRVWMIGRLNMTKSMVPFLHLKFWSRRIFHISPCSGKWSASGAYDTGQFMPLTWHRESTVWFQGFSSDINLWNWWCWSFAVPNWVLQMSAVGQIIGTVSRKDEQNVTVKHLSALRWWIGSHPTNESSWRLCGEAQM